jgi:hypothetical protein
MPQWSGWKKLALVCTVCGVHLALLTGFNLNLVLGKPSNIANITTEKLSMTLLQASSQPLSDSLAKPQEQTSAIDSEAADVQTAATGQKSVLPESPFWTGLQNRDYFLDSEAVDKTAEPDVTFEALLAQLLPLNVQSVVLEFWIEKDGQPVEVRCIEGACTDEVTAALPKLAELTFKPAIKNGEAVANRKVIQIEASASFGL